MFIRWQLAFQLRYGDAVVLPKVLQKRGVDSCLVFRAHDAESAARTLAGNFYRNEQDRGFVLSVTRALRVRVVPFQKSTGNEERINTGLFLLSARCFVQTGKRCIELRRCHAQQYLSPSEHVVGILSQGGFSVFVRHALAGSLIAPHTAGQAFEGENRAEGQEILQHGYIGHMELKASAASTPGGAVQQGIRDAQVELPPLPLLRLTDGLFLPAFDGHVDAFRPALSPAAEDGAYPQLCPSASYIDGDKIVPVFHRRDGMQGGGRSHIERAIALILAVLTRCHDGGFDRQYIPLSNIVAYRADHRHGGRIQASVLHPHTDEGVILCDE